MSCAKKVFKPIVMLLWKKARVGPRNHILDGGANPQGKGHF